MPDRKIKFHEFHVMQNGLESDDDENPDDEGILTAHVLPERVQELRLKLSILLSKYDMDGPSAVSWQ